MMLLETKVKNSEDVKRTKLEGDKVDLDSILVNEIGQFGLYQGRYAIVCVGFVIFVAWSVSAYVFTTARITTRCLIPECDDPNPVFSPDWILNAVPGACGSSFEQCARYVNSGNSSAASTCPASFFDQSSTQPCEEYVYENTDTVVYDFDLACDEWRRSLIGSVRTFGMLCALPLTGVVSDRWGRRIALAINAINTCWIGIVRYWATTYWIFMTLEFVEATVGSGGFTCAYILMMELVGPKYRVAAGAMMNTFFAVGQILMGLIAWAVPNWRNLTLALYVPQLVTISLFWIMSESVRWLMSKGRFEEAEVCLQNVARVNGTTLSQKSLEALRRSNEEELKLRGQEALQHAAEPWLPVLVFRNRTIFKRCLVTPLWWLTTMFVFYGLSINSVNMSGNRYVNYIAVAAVEIPGYWTAVLLMGRIGRKPVLIVAFWVCAACMIAFVFIPSGILGASLAVYLVGKYAIAVVVTSIYVYTTELYPTKYRHSLFAFSSMIGRVGSILAPLTPAIGDAVFTQFPFALFAGLCIMAGCLVFLTPETMGQKMPDTMEEAAALGKKEPTEM